MANEIIKGIGVHHIALKCTDFEKSYEFYTKGLGFKEFMSWGEGDGHIALLDIGNGSCVELFAGGIKNDCPTQETGRWFHLAFKTTDTDGAFAAAIAAGAVEKIAPTDANLAGKAVRIAFVFGPDGETIEFFCI